MKTKFCWVLLIGTMMSGIPIKIILARGKDGLENIQPTTALNQQHLLQSERDQRHINKRVFRVSAYCPCEICCGQFARIPVSSGKRRTASGHIITESDYGRICAAPREYKFGTRFILPSGIGEVIARDRGGSIKAAGNTVAGKVLKFDRLDILMKDHQTALNFGVKYLECEVIE